VPIGTPDSPKNLSLLNASPFPVPKAEPSRVRRPEFAAFRLSYLISHHVEDSLLALKQTVRGRHVALACDDHQPRWPQIAALDRPAFVPPTTGRRQEMTGTAGASNPQAYEIPRWVPRMGDSSRNRPEVTPNPQVAATEAADL